MKIGTKLNIISFGSFASALSIILLLLWSYLEHNRVHEMERHVVEMQKNIFEWITLRDEFLIYRTERPLNQWQAKSAYIGSLLEKAREEFKGADKKFILSELFNDYNDLVSVFSQVITNRERDGASEEENNLSIELEHRLISQLSLKSYALSDNIQKLLASSREMTHDRERRVVFSSGLFIAAFAAIIFVNAALVRRTLSKRIEAFYKGMMILGSGKLDHRIYLEGDDELCKLADASNSMAEKLSKSYTSIENLEREATERKRMEEALLAHQEILKQRTREVQSANMELEAFSYSVSHDLKTPLRAIDGFSNVMLEEYGGKLDDEGRRILNIIRSSAQKMSQLINNLLDFSRISRQEITASEIDMNALAQGILEDLTPFLSDRDIVWDITPLSPSRGDRSMVRQVLMNLISNAVKFTRRRERAFIEVGSAVKDNEVVYHVKDNGAGFDMRYADKLFGVFQRLHSPEEFEGTGVGLAIVQRIIHRHGGRVWAESKVNGGSVFYFSLPAGNSCAADGTAVRSYKKG